MHDGVSASLLDTFPVDCVANGDFVNRDDRRGVNAHSGVALMGSIVGEVAGLEFA
jgi:hypothetical protein